MSEKDLSNDVVIHKKVDGIEYLQFRRLLEYKDRISHMYILKNEGLEFCAGSTEEEARQKVYSSYKVVCEKENLDYTRIVRPLQTHSDVVKAIDTKICQDIPDIYLDEMMSTDGLVTNKKDLILASVNADCILLLFYDPVKQVIANVHSGWKGTFEKIGQKTVEKMVKKYNCNPSDIICCMTPSIMSCCFEVHEDVKLLCEEAFAGMDILDKVLKFKKIEDGKEKYSIDLNLINQLMLEKSGLKNENIISSEICSMCNSDIVHSRRGGSPKYKAGTALIGIRK